MKRNILLRIFFLAVLAALPASLILNQLLEPASVARGKSPAAPLADGLTPEQQQAQDLALADSRVQAYTTGRRSEVFSVQPVGQQFTQASSACATADCHQVNIYLWNENAAVVAIVDVTAQVVRDVLYQPGIHPGINERLVAVAREIVRNDPQVAEILGHQPTDEELEMPPMEGNAPGTSCSGEHICYAYTFNMGDRILWAFVDFHEETLAALRWTLITPESDQGMAHTPDQGTCPINGSVNRDGWSMQYEVSGTDGYRVFSVTYNGIPVLTNVKLAEWHADYGGSGYVDSTGCSPSGGFPIYPYGPTQELDILDDQSNIIGFELVQDFRMGNWGNSCNYRYEQHVQFYEDGRWRVVAGAYGKGCGTNAIYRPLVRIDAAANGDANDTFALWNGSQWVDQTNELYRTPYAGPNGPHSYTTEGYAWRVVDQSGMGYYLEPGQGQFGDGGEGDDAFIYVAQHHPNEGDTDLGAVGSCCNDDHNQGPQQFLNNESISDENIVIWYVPQMVTDASGPDYYCWTLQGEPNPITYPCFAGPMFVPITNAAFSHNATGPVPVGSTVVFTNTSTGIPPLSYEWDFGDGVGTSTEANPTYQYTAAGTYNVTLTVTNGEGTETDTFTSVVEVSGTKQVVNWYFPIIIKP